MAENKFLDDIAKFGNSTLTAMGGMQKQVRTWVKEQVESLIKNMDLITRKELDARNADITRLLARIEELERKVGGGDETKSIKPKAKTVKPKIKPE